MNSRIKNPWFWVGLVGVVLTAMGIRAEMLTSWQVVGEAIVNLLCNPFILFSTIAAVLGVFVDPTTHGIIDKRKDIVNGE